MFGKFLSQRLHSKPFEMTGLKGTRLQTYRFKKFDLCPVKISFSQPGTSLVLLVVNKGLSKPFYSNRHKVLPTDRPVGVEVDFL